MKLLVIVLVNLGHPLMTVVFNVFHYIFTDCWQKQLLILNLLNLHFSSAKDTVESVFTHFR